MRSIRTKLFFFLMIVMVAYAGIGILLNLLFLKPYYVQQSEASFARAAAQIKALNTPQSISEHITEIGHNSGLFLAVTDPKFQILCSSNNLEGQTLPPDIINAINQVGKGERVVYTVSEDEKSAPKLIYMEWLNQDRRIVLTKAISVVDESVSIANHFYIVTGLVVFVFGSIAVFFFSRTLTRPIIQISRTAQNMAELRFDQKAEISSKDELGSLAQSINTLSVSLKSALDQLQKDVRVQKTLSRNLSHQLKTPVAVIKGHAEGLIYQVAETPEEQRKYLDVIVEECDRMNHLVREMLLLSKLSVNDQGSMQFESVNILHLCRQLQTRFSLLLQEKGLVFSCDIEQGATVNGNSKLLEHALSNYIANAVQHCTGEIIVRFEQKAGCSCISVFNTGKPIAQEALEHIFEPFYRLDYARKEDAHSGQEKGHGLGLAIVRSIAEVHGGKAYAQNRENGVEFFLEIPTA